MLVKTRAELDAALQEVIAVGEKQKNRIKAKLQAKAERLAAIEAKAAIKQQNKTKYGTTGHSSWAYRLRKRYGLTVEQYNELSAAQAGLCGICQRIMQGVCVDHDHNTGKIRGLLCRNCNTALGLFEEDPKLLELCIIYIRKHKEL